jgi:hypothetical protein
VSVDLPTQVIRWGVVHERTVGRDWGKFDPSNRGRGYCAVGLTIREFHLDARKAGWHPLFLNREQVQDSFRVLYRWSASVRDSFRAGSAELR